MIPRLISLVPAAIISAAEFKYIISIRPSSGAHLDRGQSVR